MRGVLLFTTHPMPEDANTTLDSTPNELTFPARGHRSPWFAATYGRISQEFIIFWFIRPKPNVEIDTDKHDPRD